ncbi:MAG: ribonuclease HII [Candidatus Marinimicrobia bacterium]|nr:ribonuclease HII [Candidatus Neomarinimicrobiota bacterium]
MNHKVLAGVDEAGRGPLAGPVVAAAVILNPADIPEGLRDSKKISAKKREKLAVEISQRALYVGVGIVHEQDIDRWNILQATFEAMRRAVANLGIQPTEVQVDGNFTIPDLRLNQKAIVGGDDLVQEISAASIIAKTTRDAMMVSYDKLFPEYGFKSHKGYGAKTHMDLLRSKGRTPIHRRSFRPVAESTNLNYRYFNQESAYGRMGEIIAGMYLIRNGYQLLVHSYHAGRDGEIDLIAARENEIVFVEVKSFGGESDDTVALERVTAAKQKQIARIAEIYLEKHEIEQPECRFDIITVNFSRPKPDIKHYEEAFLPL